MTGKLSNAKTDPALDTTMIDDPANRDPLTDEPGSHPVATGVGAALAGATAGAVIGAVGAGPIGIGVGVVTGAVLGAFAGHEFGEGIDPTVEREYWRESFRTRPYVDSEHADYDRYAPAYEYGWESYARYGKDEDGNDVDFDDVEADLGRAWDDAYDADELSWAAARPAARDAWDRAREFAHRTDLQHKPR